MISTPQIFCSAEKICAKYHWKLYYLFSLFFFFGGWKGSPCCGKDRGAVCMSHGLFLRMLQFSKALSSWVPNQSWEKLSSSVLIRSFSLLTVGFPRLPGSAKHWLLWPAKVWLLQKVNLQIQHIKPLSGRTSALIFGQTQQAELHWLWWHYLVGTRRKEES